MASVFAKRGYTGPYVQSVQRKLSKVLKEPGLADDGIFGGKTEDAVIVFQSVRFLEVDGLVGEFTDAALFDRELEKLQKRRPVHVHQGNTLRCWAAATESWLSTTSRLRIDQADLVARLVAERGARARDGALLIPFGQGLWEGFFGLRPKNIEPTDLTAEDCSRMLAKFGPLLFGMRSTGSTGHVRVMWGVRVRRGRPMLEFIDPLSTTGSPTSVAIEDLRGFTGGVTVWLPTRLPLPL